MGGTACRVRAEVMAVERRGQSRLLTCQAKKVVPLGFERGVSTVMVHVCCSTSDGGVEVVVGESSSVGDGVDGEDAMVVVSSSSAEEIETSSSPVETSCGGDGDGEGGGDGGGEGGGDGGGEGGGDGGGVSHRYGCLSSHCMTWTAASPERRVRMELVGRNAARA